MSVGKIPQSFGSELPAIDAAFAYVAEAHPPKSRSGQRVVVCHTSEITDGERRIVSVTDALSIGVFRINGEFYAIKNVCPHNGAPLCLGNIQTTHEPSDAREFRPALAGRVLRCPWHGWEFDIPTGKGLYDRMGRVATYVTELDTEGNIVIVL